MAKSMPFTFQENLGVDYGRALIAVPFAGTHAVTDQATGAVFPVQTLPALAADSVTGPEVTLALVAITPGATLQLKPSRQTVATTGIATENDGATLVIRNGDRSVRLPNHGDVVAPCPGPILGMSVSDGEWYGDSQLVDVPCRAHVRTVVEAMGACAVQWRTTYRWGASAGVTLVMRWPTGSDTIQVEETIAEDTAAAWEWLPLGAETRAQSYWRGGGEWVSAMQVLDCHYAPQAHSGLGRRYLGALGHVAYWNQWNISWAAFAATAGEPAFAGIFSGWGGHWQAPGSTRIELYQDDTFGDLARFPLRRGRRHYGLLFTSPEEANITDGTRRCLLNRRKVQFSDLRPAKVAQWNLTPACESRQLNLLAAKDLADFRERLARDPQLPQALDGYLQTHYQAEHGIAGAAALWQNDAAKLQARAATITTWANRNLADIADGGYERLIIFDGRAIKRLAFDVDVLWTLGHMTEPQYQAVRRSFIATAWMYADPDYCRTADFYPRADDGSGIFQALQNEMGDCPVPPNFLAEFFSTTALVAELYPSYPEALNWRAWGMARLDEFLAGYFAPDGTYAESVNYHSHCFNEMLCQMIPLWVKGVRDYFAEPRVKGSFRHFVAIQMPAVSNHLPDLAAREKKVPGYHLLGNPATPRAPMPDDGNSGGHGDEQDYDEQLTLAAWIYRRTEPELSAQLMHTWRVGGKPLLGGCHPVATLLMLDPAMPATPAPWTSTQRQTLGIFCKARQPDDTPVYALFRAGKATHHMDFDQGNLHLACGDRVLLGDPGYHTCDATGQSIPACATWLHNTIVYSDHRDMSSGYTGLEHAPEPALVHLGPVFDWCVHRIVNRQYRDLTRFRYTVQLPAPETRHVRHLLFVKPDYFLVWDVFEEAPFPATFWLHPTGPMKKVAPGCFQSGDDAGVNLFVQFVLPAKPEIAENSAGGPLWNFAIRQAPGLPFLTLLVPGRGTCGRRATLAADGRTVTVLGPRGSDTIRLPPPGSASALPELRRG